MELLEDVCIVTADGRIELTPAALSMTGTDVIGPGSRNAAAAAAAAGGTVNGAATGGSSGEAGAGSDKRRKWHEKFKAQRDAAAAAHKKR